MKYKFKWEKWIDPLKPSDFKQEQEDDEDYLENEVGSFKAFPTPFGILSITNHVLASTKFDFWILHTNFRITNSLVDEVKEVPGVETMNVLTRYRCRFGFPMSGLFDNKNTRNRIEDTALSFFRKKQDQLLQSFDCETIEKAKEVRDNLDEHNEHWAMYVLPNGNMEIVKQKKMRDNLFNERLDLFRSIHQLVGGTILTSDEG